MEDGLVFKKQSLYIHIGYPKTGTTYLQKYFSSVHSEKINYIGQRKIWDTLHKICYQDEFSYSEQVAYTEISLHLKDTINIISFESLVGNVFHKQVNAKLIADRIKSLFPQAKIIITIRNQKKWLYSIYKQYIHEGGTISLNSFFNYDETGFNSSWELDDQRFNVNCFSYDKLINYYKSIFGFDNVKVLLFEEFLTDKKVYINRLNQFLKLNNDNYELSNEIANKGYGKWQIRIAQSCNRFLYSHLNRNSLNFSFIRLYPYKSKLDTFFLRKVLQSKLSFHILGNVNINSESMDKEIENLFYLKNKNLEKFIDRDLIHLFRKYYFLIGEK